MNHFQRKKGVLHAEAIPLESLADAHGTPLYVYSTATLTRHWKVLNRSLAGVRHLVCYAVKANSNLAGRCQRTLGAGAAAEQPIGRRVGGWRPRPRPRPRPRAGAV